MASRIAGITIEIGGDTTKLQASLSGLDKSIKSTSNQLKDVNKLLKLDPKNTELLTQKQKALESSIDLTKKRLEELKAAQNGVEQGSEQWDALQREIIATEQSLAGLEQQYRDFGSVGAQQIAAVGREMESFGGKVESAGKALAPLSGAAAGLIGSLGKLAYSSITAADDLETLSKQTGISTDELQKMQYASELVDVSVEDIVGALKKMKPKMDASNETFKKLGVSVTDVDGNLRSATDVFYDSLGALSKVGNETERDQLAMELFGKGADSLAGIIDDGGKALRDYGKEAEDLGLIMGGDTLDSLNEMNDTLSRSKSVIKSSLGRLGATAAKTFAPALEKAAKVVDKLSEKLRNLTPEQTELITKIAGVVAVVAPLLIGLGKTISLVGKVLAIVPKVTAAINLLSASALGPIILVIAAVVAAGILLWKNWDKVKAAAAALKESLTKAWEATKTAVVTAATKLKDGVSTAWTNLKTAVTTAMTNLKTAVETAWTNLKTSVTTTVTNLKTSVTTTWENLKTAVSTAVTNLKTSLETTWTNIKTNVTTTVENLKTSVATTWENLKTAVSTAVTNLKTSLETTWTNIKTSVSTTVTNLKNSVVGTWDTLKTNVTTAVTNVKDTVGGAWDTLKTNVTTAATTLKTNVSNAFTNLKTAVATPINTLKTTVGGIATKITSVWNTVKTYVDKLKSAFNFSWSLPSIKLPHFKVTGGVAPYGIGGKGSLPKITVEWYRKAYDNPVMFTQPTVLQTASGYKGFGDGHGAEIVMGLNKLRELVGASSTGVTVNVYGSPGQSVNELADAVAQRIILTQQQRSRAYA